MARRKLGLKCNFGKAMKMFKVWMLIAVAAMAFTGCSKEEIEDQSVVSNKKTVEFSSVSADTRTAFGDPNGTTYPTLWSGDETIRVGLNHASNNQATKEAQITTEDNIKASWTAEIEDDGSDSYTFYALSPAVAFNSTRADGWSVKIPESQTPSDNSCDETAQVLVAKSKAFTEFPAGVSMHFQHFTAYGKLTLKNLNLDGATVQSIALTAEDYIVGRFNYTFETGEVAVNSASATLTINTNKTENVWFAIRPCDLATSALKVVVTTDKGTFTKEVEVPEGCAFKAGVIANMTINMEGIAIEGPDYWTLVTNAGQLNAGDMVVIAAKDYEVAISTTQNNNNRGQAAINKVDENNITIGEGVQVFTVEDGTKSGTLAFNTGSGYIYAASSGSNHLRTQTTLNDNASWRLTFDAGYAKLVAQGTNTRNTLQYNLNSTIFSCYGSASQKQIALYYKKGSTAPTFEVLDSTVEVNDLATSAEFTVKGNVAWTATITEGAATFDNGSTTMTGEGGASVKVNFAENTVAEAKTYKVTVSTEAEVATKSYEVVINQAAATTHAFYVPVTAVTAGKKYLIVANNSGIYYAASAVPSNKTYAYLPTATVTVTEEGIMSDDTTDALAFTINATDAEGIYNIIDINGKYMYQTGSYDSFNVSATEPTSGADWQITIDADGLATIKNTSVNKWAQYDTSFGTYGSYNTQKGILPQLYMLQE